MTPEIKPRRPFDDDCPEGYLESDRDFVDNNLEACVSFLEAAQKRGESKHLVISFEDIEKYLTSSNAWALMALASMIDKGRCDDGRKQIDCAVVEF